MVAAVYAGRGLHALCVTAEVAASQRDPHSVRHNYPKRPLYSSASSFKSFEEGICKETYQPFSRERSMSCGDTLARNTFFDLDTECDTRVPAQLLFLKEGANFVINWRWNMTRATRDKTESKLMDYSENV